MAGWAAACGGTFQRTKLFAGSVHARVLINTEYAEPFFGHALISEVDSLVENGLLSSADRDEFRNQVQGLASCGEFFYSITGYVFAGRALVLS